MFKLNGIYILKINICIHYINYVYISNYPKTKKNVYLSRESKPKINKTFSENCRFDFIESLHGTK